MARILIEKCNKMIELGILHNKEDLVSPIHELKAIVSSNYDIEFGSLRMPKRISDNHEIRLLSSQIVEILKKIIDEEDSITLFPYYRYFDVLARGK